MAVGSAQFVQVCTVATSPCPLLNQAVVQAYLIDPAYQTQTEIMLSQSGIDWAVVQESFGYGLLLFAVGLGLGMIVNLIKKVR